MTARAMVPALLVALTGCGLPANVVVLLPDENGAVGKVTVREGDTTAELTKPLAAVNAGSEVALRDVFTAPRSDVDIGVCRRSCRRAAGSVDLCPIFSDRID